MRAILVSHTHWDREWYRTFEAFRARLVDAVDRVLDLCREDPGYRFLLDGQVILLEDYAGLRPERLPELLAQRREGRLSLGPWYVQPDSLLPHGESQVRNLLAGRRAGARFGGASRVAYTPDSFGHPAQMPQILAGFGLEAFVYWRGNGDEITRLPLEYAWEAPDGSRILACHLARGYFAAATAPGADLGRAAKRLAGVARELADRTRSDRVLLPNGIDHALPEPRTAELARATAAELGWPVERGHLEDYVRGIDPGDAVHRGELVGGRVAPLLPGVWSTRSWIKLANRRAEAALLGHAEPWAALARLLPADARSRLRDEAAALRSAWRLLLENHAHDSICGCSRDEVHEQMRPRFDRALERASETATRVLERFAGLGAGRLPPWSSAFELAVFNPSPHPRSGRVRFAIDPHPHLVPAEDPAEAVHPLVLHDLRGRGFRADGRPVRLVERHPVDRPVLLPDRAAFDLEFEVEEIPAFGWRRVRIEPGPAHPDRALPGTGIESGSLRVEAHPDGRFDLHGPGKSYRGLGELEDTGDRGDSYDFDPVEEGGAVETASVEIHREELADGAQRLRIERRLLVPEALAPGRDRRSEARVELPVTVGLLLAPGSPGLRVDIRLDNTARDHRLRIAFPLGAATCRAATTFDVVDRGPAAAPGEGWVQRPPTTFPHQGFVEAAGLLVVAPGLSEAELRPDGALAFTLLRSVGFLSRHDLHTRAGPAGPGTAVPGAWCPGPLACQLWLVPGGDARTAWDLEAPLRAVFAGREPLLPEARALLELAPRELLLSCLKPAEDGEGAIARVLNPTDRRLTARLRVGLAVRGEPVRLDESPADFDLRRREGAFEFGVPAHALRSLRLRPA